MLPCPYSNWNAGDEYRLNARSKARFRESKEGEIPWINLDDLNRMILEDLLKQYEIEGLRCRKPWPDSVEGLGRLRNKYIICPISNGNVALMTYLAKFGGLPWDVILGPDLVKHYKPDRKMYLSAPF